MGGVETLVSVGRVVKPHGIRGAFKVAPLIERTDRIIKALKVFVRTGESAGMWMDVEWGRVQGESIVLKLKGIDDRNQAEEYRKADIQLPEIDDDVLPEGTYIASSLIGFHAVSEDGKTIGTVVDILNMPAQDVFVVKSEKGEILIPAVKAFIVHVDVEAKRIIISWIEGLW